jgi:predicted dehydrogenase
MSNRDSLRTGWSRRGLLRGGAALGALTAFQGGAHSQGRIRGPNDRINVAAIGAGGMGAGNMAALTGENIIAYADVDLGRVDRSIRESDGALRADRVALKAAYDAAHHYSDYRRMLDERKDLDAVVIATPDHHHAIAARMAMERGLHVYVQKPLTYSVEESRLLLDLSRRNPRLVTQMGNQGHSSDDGRRVVELIRGGAIGKVREVHIWTNRPVWPQGVPKPAAVAAPASLNWDLWLGPADVDWGYHRDYAHFNWRGWTPFGTGALGDMGAHLMDFPVWALELGLPTRIETRHTLWGGDDDPWDYKRPEVLTSYPLSAITYFEFGNAKGGPVRLNWYDGGLAPPSIRNLPAGRVMEEEGGVVFIGEAGMLLHDTYGAKPTLIGEDAVARGQSIPVTLPRIRDGSKGHEQNWARAIRGEEAISHPFEMACGLNETMLLGILAMRAGGPIEYDGVAGRVTNMPEANALLGRTYRNGWHLT